MLEEPAAQEMRRRHLSLGHMNIEILTNLCLGGEYVCSGEWYYLHGNFSKDSLKRQRDLRRHRYVLPLC